MLLDALMDKVVNAVLLLVWRGCVLGGFGNRHVLGRVFDKYLFQRWCHQNIFNYVRDEDFDLDRDGGKWNSDVHCGGGGKLGRGDVDELGGSGNGACDLLGLGLCGSSCHGHWDVGGVDGRRGRNLTRRRQIEHCCHGMP